MYFRDIVGHDSLKAQLLTTARQGLVPHAQLFTGRDGEGALGLAYAYARYLNCTDRGEWDACGHCPSCRRYDEVGDPDLSFLYPIVNASGKNLCEDHIEDWRRFIQQGPIPIMMNGLDSSEAMGKRPRSSLAKASPCSA